MKRYSRLQMGSAPPPDTTAARFWNMVNVSDKEAEIILYGDIMSRQPVDWWTGEPKPGFYITPEGFMDDLETVKNKEHITVKLNSCGGDLYTGIAIHNALKALSGDVNVIVDGIAASAASVIMCAGDTVTVYPGSLIMIHGVSIYLWDSVNIQDMEQLMKGMEASERAVAEIYNAKTGIGVDTLREMMAGETWFTGKEAMEQGFADCILEDEEDPEISMSHDRKVLYVNGIGHNMEGIRHIPGGIPVRKSAKPAIRPAANRKTAGQPVKTEGEKKHMTYEELKLQEPELLSQIEADARNAAVQQAGADAAAAERQRLADIDSIAGSIPDQQMVQDAKYGENPCSAQELAFRVMQESAAQGQKFLADYTSDGAASRTGKVSAAPNNGVPVSQEEEDAADIQAVVNAYNQSKGGIQ